MRAHCNQRTLPGILVARIVVESPRLGLPPTPVLHRFPLGVAELAVDLEPDCWGQETVTRREKQDEFSLRPEDRVRRRRD